MRQTQARGAYRCRLDLGPCFCEAFSLRSSATSRSFHRQSLRPSLNEIMTVRQGQMRNLADPVPSWLKNNLKGTKYDLSRARDEIAANPEIHDPGPER